jgi:carbon-monoxide dehydrogenase catalytic subunit
MKIEDFYHSQKKKEKEIKSGKEIKSLEERARKFKVETIFERTKKIIKNECELGAIGVCCNLCNMGPCIVRTSAFASLSQNENLSWKGICGADADLIVSRNILRSILPGASANAIHVLRFANILKNISEGKSQFTISDHRKLLEVSDVLKISKRENLAEKIAEISIRDITNSDEMNFLCYLNEITKKRLKQNNILPSALLIEICNALKKTSFGAGNDPRDVFLQTLKLSLASGFSTIISSEIQDIIFGVSKPKISFVDLGVIRKDKVNILLIGEFPLLAKKIAEHASDDDLNELAISKGANGISVYGMCNTGKEILKRDGIKFLGGISMQEYTILTGAIDLVVSDIGCILENLQNICKQFHTKIINTEKETIFQNTEFIEFNEREADEISRRIIKIAIDNFENRGSVLIPENKSRVITGFSYESFIEKFGSLSTLINVIKEGKIKGIAVIFGCNGNLDIVRELIKRDVLVLTIGCNSFEIAKEGLMRIEAAEIAGRNLKIVCEALKIPPVIDFGNCNDIASIFILCDRISRAIKNEISSIPVITISSGLNDKTILDAFFFSSIGLTTILTQVPKIFGSEKYIEFITKEMEKMTGGKIVVELDSKVILEIVESEFGKKLIGF